MIYHLVDSDTWEALLESDQNSYKAASLETEGFIHCSTKEQLLPSARLHFADFDELVVLEIPPKGVKSILKWEESRNGELFPHLYGPLPLGAVETIYMLMRLPGGDWEEVR